MNTKRVFLVIVLFIVVSLPAPALTGDFFSARRQTLMDKMDGGVAMLFASGDANVLNKNFYYLTGCNDPQAMLLLLPGESVQEVLFTESGEWAQAEDTSTAESYTLADVNRNLASFLRGKNLLYVSFSDLVSLAEYGRILSSFTTLKNIDPFLVELRVLKDEYEITILKKACLVTAEGLNDVFRAVEPGLTEKELALMLEDGFKRRGSGGYSFLQAASGPNSTNIHFGATERKIKNDDMIVFDVGALWEEYTADISRSIPVSGHFTQEQRQIYQVVLDAQKAGIEHMIPGAKLLDVQKIAEDVLIHGLFELGLVLDEKSEWQRRLFIQHGFYHFIGLDVHDVWYDYRRDIAEKVYEPGMIMTFEPGLYFPENLLDTLPRSIRNQVNESEFESYVNKIQPIYNKYVNMGVRVEDDILITNNGNEVITAAVPKEITDIEKMMKETSPHNQFKL